MGFSFRFFGLTLFLWYRSRSWSLFGAWACI